MPRVPILALAVPLLLLSQAPIATSLAATTPPAASATITVEHPWARATPPNATTAAAYLTLTDHGAPDQVTGASTPVAAMAGLHQTIDNKGVMEMRDAGPLPLDPAKPLSFAPGGYHIMLMGLKHPLKQGEHFPLTLSFAHAAPLTVDITVEGLGSAAPMAMPMNHGGMNMGGMNMGGASK
jgi:copper(I)-binding protein